MSLERRSEPAIQAGSPAGLSRTAFAFVVLGCLAAFLLILFSGRVREFGGRSALETSAWLSFGAVIVGTALGFCSRSRTLGKISLCAGLVLIAAFLVRLLSSSGPSSR
jgi:hypothetical protein